MKLWLNLRTVLAHSKYHLLSSLTVLSATEKDNNDMMKGAEHIMEFREVFLCQLLNY